MSVDQAADFESLCVCVCECVLRCSLNVIRGQRDNQTKGKPRNTWWGEGRGSAGRDLRVDRCTAQRKCDWFVTEHYSWEESIPHPASFPTECWE